MDANLNAIEKIKGVSPGIVERAKELLAVGFLVKGEVSEELAEQRANVCLSCPNRDEKKGICKLCGCILHIKVKCSVNNNPGKARQEITHCPDGRWPHPEKPNETDKEIANIYRQMEGVLPL